MSAAAARKRALLVEDDAAIRELVRFHLDLSGYDVAEAGDGRLALEQTRAVTFDLILLDVMLPGLDGVTVCRAIRLEARNQQTPILMVTARDGESDTVIGLESGADDYLAKPFGVRELMARVTAITRRHGRPGPDTAPGDVVTSGGLTVDRLRRCTGHMLQKYAAGVKRWPTRIAECQSCPKSRPFAVCSSRRCKARGSGASSSIVPTFAFPFRITSSSGSAARPRTP